jgi:hypothetical protein
VVEGLGALAEAEPGSPRITIDIILSCAGHVSSAVPGTGVYQKLALLTTFEAPVWSASFETDVVGAVIIYRYPLLVIPLKNMAA